MKIQIFIATFEFSMNTTFKWVQNKPSIGLGFL